MRSWETVPLAGGSAAFRDFAGIWRAADKVVYSTTLREAAPRGPGSSRDFDPERVRELKRQGDVTIGGPTLAAAAIEAGLVDEYHLLLVPVAVGGGTPVFPPATRVPLDLVDQRRFAGGVAYLRYLPRT